MKFIVIGDQGAGKTTFGTMLASALGTRATDTSAALIEIEVERINILAEHMAANLNVDVNDILASVRAHPDLWDAERDRPARVSLVALGDAMKVADKSILATLCFAKGDVCVGVRRADELKAARDAYPDARVIAVLRGDAERDPSDNYDIPWSSADYVYDNSGPIAGMSNVVQFIRDTIEDGTLPDPNDLGPIQLRA